MQKKVDRCVYYTKFTIFSHKFMQKKKNYYVKFIYEINLNYRK